MTHSSAKFSHNGLKAAVEGGGEEQVVDIRPSRLHVSNLFPVDASASDVTMYEGGFPLAFFPSYSSIYTPRRGRPRQAQFSAIYLPLYPWCWYGVIYGISPLLCLLLLARFWRLGMSYGDSSIQRPGK